MTIQESLKTEFINIIKETVKNTIKGAVKRKHARLVTTKTNAELDILVAKIQQYFENKVREFKSSGKSVAMLKAKHANEILSYIEAQTTLAYILGLKYVQKSKDIIPDITALEEHKILLITKKYSESFWKNLQKNQDQVLGIKGASFFDFIFSLARTIVFHSANDATVQFGVQLSAGLRHGTVAREPVFEFVTARDDRVDCRICAPLDGILMTPSSPEFAQPPLHVNCRCRLLLHVDGETLSG